MKNNFAISKNQTLLYKCDELICSNCGSTNLETITSKSNSTYEYCKDCDCEKENSFKHQALDYILADIKNTLELYKEKSINYLKIEIIQSNNTINLLINDVEVSGLDFPHKFVNTDIYFLENTISDLIEDFYNVEDLRTDILICI